MFTLKKLYRNRCAVTLMGLDHGQLVDLMFGEVIPDIMGDSNWSFSVSKIPPRTHNCVSTWQRRLH